MSRVASARVPAAFLIGMFACSPVQARPTAPVATMAAILTELVHVCSPVQRDRLEAVIRDDSTTGPERVIARAILRILHLPHPDDLAELKRLADDESVRDDVRTLARIVVRFVHVATPADRLTLAALSSSAPQG